MKEQRIISGIQPSGSLTLGNYLGAMSLFSDLQKQNELILFVADLHSLTTVNHDPARLANDSLNVVKHYLASGIKRERCHFFVQSHLCEHAELSYLLMCHSVLGELYRMTQFKAKANITQANKTESTPTGLLIYPILMAADILLYQPNLVPIGHDQMQHLELTRDVAMRFNKRYGQTFTIPEPYLSKWTSRIMDLQNPLVKMSKSSTNTKGVIFLLDPIATSLKKVRSALTDSYNQISANQIKQPGVYNLLSIYVGLKNSSLLNSKQPLVTLESVVGYFQRKTYADLKDELARLLQEFLTKYQKNYVQIDQKTVVDVLKAGTSYCQPIACATLRDVKNKIGLLHFEKNLN